MVYRALRRRFWDLHAPCEPGFTFDGEILILYNANVWGTFASGISTPPGPLLVFDAVGASLINPVYVSVVILVGLKDLGIFVILARLVHPSPSRTTATPPPLDNPGPLKGQTRHLTAG